LRFHGVESCEYALLKRAAAIQISGVLFAHWSNYAACPRFFQVF
jgi:hypothetical protein